MEKKVAENFQNFVNNAKQTRSTRQMQEVQQQQEPQQQQQQQQQQDIPQPNPVEPANPSFDSIDGEFAVLMRNLQEEVIFLKRQQEATEKVAINIQNSFTNFIEIEQQNKNLIEQIMHQQRQFGDMITHGLNLAKAPSTEMSDNLKRILEEVNFVRQSQTNIGSNGNSNAQTLLKQIEQMSKTLVEMKTKIEATKQSQQTIEEKIKDNTASLNDTIERSTSFGFWTFFILFQCIFGIAFMYWKKYRDDAEKKNF